MGKNQIGYAQASASDTGLAPSNVWIFGYEVNALNHIHFTFSIAVYVIWGIIAYVRKISGYESQPCWWKTAVPHADLTLYDTSSPVTVKRVAYKRMVR